MTNNNFPEDYRFSYSALTLYEQCPYAFYCKYIKGLPDKPNFFSQYGTFMHFLLEKFAKGKSSSDEILQEYIKDFNKYVTELPQKADLRWSYFDKGFSYLEGFDGFSGEIYDVEKKFDIIMGGINLTGFIDLVLERDNKLIIMDHKSTAITSIRPKAKIEKAQRQLYLYSAWVFSAFGRMPDELIWNCFRDGKEVVVKFNIDDYNKTIDWMKDAVNRIQNEIEWSKIDNGYFCHNICSYLNNCGGYFSEN